METLLVECVDGKPYSRWWLPMADGEVYQKRLGRNKMGGTHSAE